MEFNKIISDNTPVLVDFFATWCGPCKMQAPILEQVKQKFGDQLRILKIDVDKNPKLAAKYQVRGVPTLVLFKQAKQLWRKSGVVSASELTKLLQQKL
ncbi:MAG: thioredoxin [Flavobacteriaceae bacterium]|nr:thioredoxin [Flavobacteriaceae bacterium]